jgi:hypothetical protein
VYNYAQNIVIDDALVKEALAVFNVRTKRELIDRALRKFVARHKRKDLWTCMRGVVHAGDIPGLDQVGRVGARVKRCVSTRGKPLLRLLLSLLIGAKVLNVWAEDTRQPVELPPLMQAHMLANMRDHLVALQTITRQLAEGQYEAAAETAENRLGMSAMQAHGAARMAPFMPEPMRVIGSAMHHAASRFAIAARDAEVTGDLGAAFGALSQVMQQCVACHEGFRVH